MHELGVPGRMEIYRDGEFVSFIGCMGYRDEFGVDDNGVTGCLETNYDFDYQREVPMVDAVVVKPGDVLRQVCEYDTRNVNEPTRSGYATHEEMCQTFVSVFPASNVINPFAFTSEAMLIVAAVRSKRTGGPLFDLKVKNNCVGSIVDFTYLRVSPTLLRSITLF